MNPLKQLVDGCKGTVSVTINQHRNYYESVQQYVTGLYDDIEPDVLAEMIRLNTVVEVQFYKFTPVGFVAIVHYDLETALRQAVESMEKLT